MTSCINLVTSMDSSKLKRKQEAKEDFLLNPICILALHSEYLFICTKYTNKEVHAALVHGIDPQNREIVSEYDQEIPQSQTADNPKAPRGRANQPSRDTRETN